jgi:hypothetical protein
MKTGRVAKKGGTTLHLGHRDAAVVFTPKGGKHLILPTLPANATVPNHCMDALRAAMLFKCPEAEALITAYLEAKRKEIPVG